MPYLKPIDSKVKIYIVTSVSKIKVI